MKWRSWPLNLWFSSWSCISARLLRRRGAGRRRSGSPRETALARGRFLRVPGARALVEVHAAETLDIAPRAERLERELAGLDEVDGVRRAEALREDVLHAERLDDRADRRARDDAGTGRSRRQEALRGAVLRLDL